MLKPTDLRAIDTEYFDIIEVRDYSLTIHSRNTGHDWYLLEQEYNRHRTFQIRHRHNPTDPYHPQKNKPTIEACCEYIKTHDAFHLERAQKRKEQRRHNFKELLHKQEVNTCTPDTDPLSWSSHRGDACKEASSSNGSKRVQDHLDGK